MRRVLAAQALLFPSVALPWIYSEHRDIAVAAFDRLSPMDRAALDRLWAEARPALEGRPCEKADAGDQGLEPACIDFAAFAALSGDHSCSPRELVEKVLPSAWALEVARIAAETKRRLETATTREQN